MNIKDASETVKKEKINIKAASEKAKKERMDIKEVSETAKKKLAEVLNKKANSTASISKEGDFWNAIIEMVDEEYLPGKNIDSMNDIIGVYDVKLNSKGELESYNKKSSHKRGNPTNT